MDILLLTPPSTQLNTPYPATGYLTRYLATLGQPARQADLGVTLFSALFSSAGLSRVFDLVEAAAEQGLPEPAWDALAMRDWHESVADRVLSFLRGTDAGAATGWARAGSLPMGPRLARAQATRFGAMGITDLARYRCTLYLEDLTDLVTSVVDPGFGFSRYQHHLAVGPVSFAPIAERLAQTTLPDAILDELVDALVARGVPDVVGITIPFPGTLYGALRVGRRLRERGAYVVFGGGYVSTELREVEERGLWTCADALVMDDGEGPLTAILDHLSGDGDRRHRTRTADGLHNHAPTRVAFTCAASVAGLDLSPYLQVLDSLNPAHRLWSDGRWNKMTLAHGCYWKKCAFCDIHLDYVARYEPAQTARLLDHIEELVNETGVSGFHFVDEAAPPRLLRDLALGLLERGLRIHFWGNIRFEEAFTADLCRLLAAAGLVAVTGGLEVASDRLLKQMDKGITVEQAVRASSRFRAAGVMVHAYLMYGFPTQTDAETVDSMEVVRQMFQHQVLDSAFWHRFVLTRHSAVFSDPDRFSVKVTVPTGPLFATNDLEHHDPTGGRHDRFDAPLATALASWMAGERIDQPVSRWFSHSVPSPVSPSDRVARAVASPFDDWKPGARLIWLGRGVAESDEHVRLYGVDGQPEDIGGSEDIRQWLVEVLDQARPGGEPLTVEQALGVFPGRMRKWRRNLDKVRRAGLVAV